MKKTIGAEIVFCLIISNTLNNTVTQKSMHYDYLSLQMMVFVPSKELVYRFLTFEIYLFLPLLFLIINGSPHKVMNKMKRTLVFFLYKEYT